MKKLLTLLSFLSSVFLTAQITDTIDVCFDKSVYLVFDDVVKFDFGSQGIIVRDAGNKVIIQAAEEGFPETNLLIECQDRYFLFIVRYSDNPQKLLYNYQSSGGSNSTTGENNNSSTNTELVDHKKRADLNRDQFVRDSLNALFSGNCQKVMSMPQDIFNRGALVGKMEVMLTNMCVSGDNFYLKFSINNKSKIAYDLGFLEFKVRNVKTTIKESSDQVITISPLFIYNEQKRVEGKQRVEMVVVIKKVTLKTDKKLVVEMWETNGAIDDEGGRKMAFDIKSEDIMNIKSL